MITIVDYGMGNLGSIKNMLKRVGASAVITGLPDEIAKAEKLILPGVGSFDNGIQNLRQLGLIPVLVQKVLEEKTPILGICLGMQLMTRGSEEGDLPGLGWIDADTRRFNFGVGLHSLKVPHMGWNSVRPAKPSEIFLDMYSEPRFYFVHSYHVVCYHREDVLSWTTYGYEFVSALERGNIVGVQFHPEKSHKYGMKILSDFAGNGAPHDC